MHTLWSSLLTHPNEITQYLIYVAHEVGQAPRKPAEDARLDQRHHAKHSSTDKAAAVPS